MENHASPFRVARSARWRFSVTNSLRKGAGEKMMLFMANTRTLTFKRCPGKAIESWILHGAAVLVNVWGNRVPVVQEYLLYSVHFYSLIEYSCIFQIHVYLSFQMMWHVVLAPTTCLNEPRTSVFVRHVVSMRFHRDHVQVQTHRYYVHRCVLSVLPSHLFLAFRSATYSFSSATFSSSILEAGSQSLKVSHYFRCKERNCSRK